jgi:hypothetical protein
MTKQYVLPTPAPEGYAIATREEFDAPAKRQVKRLFWILEAIVMTLAALLILGTAKEGYVVAVISLLITFGISSLVLIFVTMVLSVLFIPALRHNVEDLWAAHDYLWYRKAFPTFARDNGDVVCRHCGSTHTTMSKLLKNTFLNVHACGRCGKTLYYSRENNT